MCAKHRLRTTQTYEYVLSSVLTLQIIIAMIVLKLNTQHPCELCDFAIKQEALQVLPNSRRFCEWDTRYGDDEGLLPKIDGISVYLVSPPETPQALITYTIISPQL